MSSNVMVATSGKTVPRQDKCYRCGGSMLYWVEDETSTRMFCDNAKCSLWLTDFVVPK